MAKVEIAEVNRTSDVSIPTIHPFGWDSLDTAPLQAYGMICMVGRVTPSHAEEWLGDSPVAATAPHVAYKLHDSPLIFGRDGRLLGGHERLALCVVTGLPFDAVLLVGVEGHFVP